MSIYITRNNSFCVKKRKIGGRVIFFFYLSIDMLIVIKMLDYFYYICDFQILLRKKK